MPVLILGRPRRHVVHELDAILPLVLAQLGPVVNVHHLANVLPERGDGRHLHVGHFPPLVEAHPADGLVHGLEEDVEHVPVADLAALPVWLVEEVCAGDALGQGLGSRWEIYVAEGDLWSEGRALR